jgi:hypothetical protein
MSRFEKIKKMFIIALGFALATYFIMSGMAMLESEQKSQPMKSEVQNSK